MKLDETIIPSVRELKYLSLACQTTSPLVLLTNTHIGNLKNQVQYVHQHHKKACVQLEMIDGLATDQTAIKLLKQLFKVDALSTTSIACANTAKKIGIYSVFRFFLIDSVSLTRSLKILKHSKFDAIELLPSYCSVVFYPQIRKVVSPATTFIAGGFIRSQEQIESMFKSGINAVSTSDIKLCDFQKSS